MHILSPELPFLNQRKGENDRRKYFMINLYERTLPTSAGVEPATSWSPVGRRIQLSHRGRLRKLERKFFYTYKRRFYLLITTWYTLTFKLSIQFVRHAFHMWFLLIFYNDVYRRKFPPPCLGSRQIICNDMSTLLDHFVSSSGEREKRKKI